MPDQLSLPSRPTVTTQEIADETGCYLGHRATDFVIGKDAVAVRSLGAFFE